SEIIAGQWEGALNKLKGHPLTASTFLVDGERAPKTGEIFLQKNLAETFRKLARGGRDEFYKGSIAREIVKFSEENGGFLTMEDFEKHTSTWVKPIYANYKNYRLYELPPNGQGIAALEMLNILENVDLKPFGHNSAEYLHYLIEAKKLAYADIRQWVADPEFEDLPVDRMTSKDYGREQFRRIDPEKAQERVGTGISGNGDTIYLTVMDKDNNAVSFINSTYEHYGSGMVGGNTGIALQNRGALFSLQEGHPNVIEPNKRPFHTIIPAMAFKDGEFFMTYGVMGGAMQPQGHVQVLLNIVEFGMDIQEAIEAARFRHYSGLRVRFEPGIDQAVRDKLTTFGHDIMQHSFGAYGGGQGIIFDRNTGVMYGGSDPRKDGAAVGW
ncbi:MAG: gamma-glutamyltransferase, partial [bacterium]|nr:gamma-glutamyltransferase [bacterium]